MKHMYTILVLLVLVTISVVIYKYDNSTITTEAPTPTGTPTPELKQILPTSCIDTEPGSDGSKPIITKVDPYTILVGGMITVTGCNFSGFEGDKTLWIEDMKTGITGILFSEAGATAKSMTFQIPPSVCQKDNSYSGEPCTEFLNITPGNVYNIYTNPWGVKSNTVMIQTR